MLLTVLQFPDARLREKAVAIEKHEVDASLRALGQDGSRYACPRR